MTILKKDPKAAKKGPSQPGHIVEKTGVLIDLTEEVLAAKEEPKELGTEFNALMKSLENAAHRNQDDDSLLANQDPAIASLSNQGELGRRPSPSLPLGVLSGDSVEVSIFPLFVPHFVHNHAY